MTIFNLLQPLNYDNPRRADSKRGRIVAFGGNNYTTSDGLRQLWAYSISSNTFDCFILTQTLQLIYDIRAAIYHAHRILRPGGALLATVPSLSRIEPKLGLKTDYWRFTVASCSLLFGEVFGAGEVIVRSYGNVLSGIGFLMGMAHEELSCRELNTYDDYFPLIITIHATKQ